MSQEYLTKFDKNSHLIRRISDGHVIGIKDPDGIKNYFIKSYASLSDAQADTGLAVGPVWIAGMPYWFDGSSFNAAGGGGGATDPIELTASRDILDTDNGGRLINKTVTNITITLLADDATNEFALEQESSGTITVAGDVGVTVNGSVLDTTSIGDFLLVERTGTNEYRVRSGSA